MDVLGFGLENYDAIGKWRTMDGKFPIDVGGTMPDGKIASRRAAEMRTVLLGSMPQFSRCLIEKIMTYALGRGMQTYDNRTLDQIRQDAGRRRLSLPDADLRSGAEPAVPIAPRRTGPTDRNNRVPREKAEGDCTGNDHCAKRCPRRTFLRGLGTAAIGLPFLDAMAPALAASAVPARRPSAWRSSMCPTA